MVCGRLDGWRRSVAVERVVCTLVNDNRRVSAKTACLFHDLAAGRGWGCGIKLGRMHAERSNDTRRSRKALVAVWVECEEAGKARAGRRGETRVSLLCRSRHHDDPAMRKAHQRNALWVNAWMCCQKSQRGKCLWQPLDAY